MSNAFQWWSNYDGTYTVLIRMPHLILDYKSPWSFIDCVLDDFGDLVRISNIF